MLYSWGRFPFHHSGCGKSSERTTLDDQVVVRVPGPSQTMVFRVVDPRDKGTSVPGDLSHRRTGVLRSSRPEDEFISVHVRGVTDHITDRVLSTSRLRLPYLLTYFTLLLRPPRPGVGTLITCR